MKTISIVTSTSCHWCVEGKKLLKSHGIPFQELDSTKVPHLSQKGVPVLVVDEDGKRKTFLGFDAAKWLAFIK